MDNLISVIVTVYNNEQTLKDCILSIISQTYRNMEIIIVDDGSTDDSSKICDELLISNSKLKVTHQLHSEIAATRNKGIEMASGRYITFVNGCDKIDNSLLTNLSSMMNDYSVDVAICRTYSSTSTKLTSDKPIFFDKEDSLRQLLIGKLIENNPYGKLFDRKLFQYVDFENDDANTIYKLFEQSSRIAFLNNSEYLLTENDSFSFSSLLNKDMRIMKLYPNLETYCKLNIVKSIQNEYFDAFTNNRPLIDDDKIYNIFTKILKDNDYDIITFLSYIRRAHLYLLANDKNNYKIICPVLPDLYEKEDEN